MVGQVEDNPKRARITAPLQEKPREERFVELASIRFKLIRFDR
jgi:hypothetical protein